MTAGARYEIAIDGTRRTYRDREELSAGSRGAAQDQAT
jgi:hypothetical protein